MQRIKMPLGVIQTNCYLLNNEDQVLIIDPGAESNKIINKITELNSKPVAVLLTHAHFDHIGAVEEICNHYQIDVFVSEIEKYWLSDPVKNGSEKFKAFNIPPISTGVKPKILQKGKMKMKSFEFEVRHTPGHSPGSMSFIFEDFAIVGDTLFKDSIGRTDLYEGNHQQLINSINESLLSLDESMVICPGHGDETTVQREMDLNPFLNGF